MNLASLVEIHESEESVQLGGEDLLFLHLEDVDQAPLEVSLAYIAVEIFVEGLKSLVYGDSLTLHPSLNLLYDIIFPIEIVIEGAFRQLVSR